MCADNASDRHQTRPDAALAARYLRYIIFDKQHMKTSLWRSVRQTPDAASQVVVDLLDKELANIVQYIAFGDVSAAEADALFEASLGLMQIQLERTGKVPTALMETILRFVISHCTRSEHVAHLLFE